MSTLRAFGGGELVGDKLVRFVYLDESGTGDPSAEPFVIVSGVMVHADKQWKHVERRLTELADAFATPEDRGDFAFHANTLFTGGKKDFKDKYPRPKRHEFLRLICEIPQDFDLPVFMTSVDRALMRPKRPPMPESELVEECVMHASIGCAHGVEGFMRTHAGVDEVAMLVFEENGKTNKALRTYHNFFRTDLVTEVLRANVPNPRLRKFSAIVETLHFAGKSDSSLLQVADACAYVFQRRLRGADIDSTFYDPIRRNLMHGNSALMVEPGYRSSWLARGLQRPV